MYQNCIWARHGECNLEKHTSERKFQIIEKSGILSFDMFNIYMKKFSWSKYFPKTVS